MNECPCIKRKKVSVSSNGQSKQSKHPSNPSNTSNPSNPSHPSKSIPQTCGVCGNGNGIRALEAAPYGVTVIVFVLVTPPMLALRLRTVFETTGAVLIVKFAVPVAVTSTRSGTINGLLPAIAT